MASTTLRLPGLGWALLSLLLAALFSSCCLASASPVMNGPPTTWLSAPVPAEDTAQLRVFLPSPEARDQFLWRLAGAGVSADLTTLGFCSSRCVDLLVPEVDRQAVEAALPADAVLRTAERNLGGRLRAERDRLAGDAHRTDFSGVTRASDFFEDFRTYAQIEAFMDSLLAAYPEALSGFVSGRTFEGRPIRSMVLSVGGNSTVVDAGRRSIHLQAGQHAREWLSPPTLLYILSGFLEETSGSANLPLRDLLSQFDIYITPVVNVDGYLHTWKGDRLWRKNRRVNSGSNFLGVDLNRNWGPNSTWCTEGSSTFPGSDVYCGTEAFSEPETQAMSQLLDSLPNVALAIDYHTYGPMILYPLQHTYDPAEGDDAAHFDHLATVMADAIRAVHGQEYEPMPGSQLYPHSGGLIDYAYYTRRIPAFTVELRGDGFIVPPSNILESGEENYRGLIDILPLL
ncbi:hypothetical protein H696_00907 [Fonticula alba]|uniref:Peptidase M14 domain-containing protein n=1 Tax=Fonticula alba TaxID=691883 RepID=A0A058ZHF2_FONAL|nr:hypothetical protein H696_00907 [Fonticula alba]KCV73368.1 hypothetical protein H696_00907 [Fonticula alba]|eukprot:XP_009493069.1 hypothetical protein H696_00907 [Fonticula alba]